MCIFLLWLQIFQVLFLHLEGFEFFSRVWWLQWSVFSDLSLIVLGKKNWQKGQEEAELLLKPLASGGFKFFFEWIIGKFTFKDEWV